METFTTLLGYSYDHSGKHGDAVALNSIDELARFIVADQNDKLVCSLLDLPVLDTFGSFINRYHDTRFRDTYGNELLDALNRYQFGGDDDDDGDD